MNYTPKFIPQIKSLNSNETQFNFNRLFYLFYLFIYLFFFLRENMILYHFRWLKSAGRIIPSSTQASESERWSKVWAKQLLERLTKEQRKTEKREDNSILAEMITSKERSPCVSSSLKALTTCKQSPFKWIGVQPFSSAIRIASRAHTSATTGFQPVNWTYAKLWIDESQLKL